MACILHIETSTDICSVAVSKDGFLLYEKTDHSGPNHAERLGTYTDEALAKSVAHIKRGVDAHQKVWKLQYEYMDGHDELAPGVYRTSYSNGTKVYVNYTETPFAADDVTIPALDWIVK